MVVRDYDLHNFAIFIRLIQTSASNLSAPCKFVFLFNYSCFCWKCRINLAWEYDVLFFKSIQYETHIFNVIEFLAFVVVFELTWRPYVYAKAGYQLAKTGTLQNQSPQECIEKLLKFFYKDLCCASLFLCFQSYFYLFEIIWK